LKLPNINNMLVLKGKKRIDLPSVTKAIPMPGDATD
jgi:hypothetical protein